LPLPTAESDQSLDEVENLLRPADGLLAEFDPKYLNCSLSS
jgi:hypothetical protein